MRKISPDADTGPLAAVRAAETALRRTLTDLPALRHLPDPASDIPGLAPSVAWRNLILTGPAFRRAHLEWLEVPGRLAVLHLCIFPHLRDPSPILGFDVVAGQARISGIFLDLSPVVTPSPRPGLADLVAPAALDGFTEPRVRPVWGDIFSPDFLAIRPHGDAEVARAIALADRALAGLLGVVAGESAGGDARAIAAGQTRYVLAQRRNPHTARMLAGLIGEPAARQFVVRSLFPDPAEPVG
jgi:hypothetical protein